MRIAVMQPYFMPYGGYFRLMAAADRFVIFDDVQFPRRGYVHRNRLSGHDGTPLPFTLPLAKAPMNTAIQALEFQGDAASRLEAAARRFPCLANAAADHPLIEALWDVSGSPVDYLERTLSAAASAMGLPFEPLRSSTLALGPELKGQDRILAICDALGASAYVNAPGGMGLYEPERFAERGVELSFLTPWRGAMGSILERLLTEDATAVAEDVRTQTILIRGARHDDRPRLTAIARAAKAHWGYPPEWLAMWDAELIFTEERLAAWDVFCAEGDAGILAVGAVGYDDDAAEVEGLWVDPAAMGRGLGKALMAHLALAARRRGHPTLVIASDPNAEGFYRHIGAEPVGSIPSRPAGRELPLLHLPL